MERMRKEVKRQPQHHWASTTPFVADVSYVPDFKYLTPKIRLDHNSLPIPLVFSKTFHMVCSASRCREIVEGILQRREELQQKGHKPNTATSQRPVFVWEPVPDLCGPDGLPGLYDAMELVDVVSPNDSELAAYFGQSTWDRDNPADEKVAETIVNAGTGIGPEGTGALVVRAGRRGCYAFAKGLSLHLPACQGLNVVDPTGAGNTFLGALAETLVSPRAQFLRSVLDSALDRHQSQRWTNVCDGWKNMPALPLAMACGTVAASFVIEQVGMPSISQSAGNEDSWNGVPYTERLQQYARTLGGILDGQGASSEGS